MKPIKALLVKEGAKELYEKTLQNKIEKALGVDILKNIEKIGGLADLGLNLGLGYQEIISLKGALLWDEKNAQTDYSSFGGLNHYLYAGFAQLSYLNWHLLGEENKNNKIEKILDGYPTYAVIRPDFTDGLYASKEKIINRGDYRLTKTKELLNNGDKSIKEPDITPINYAYMIKLEGKEIPIYQADDRRSYYLYSETSNEPWKNPRFPEFREWEFVYAFDHNKILNSMHGETKEIISRGDVLDRVFDKGEDTKNNSTKTTKLDSGLLKKNIKITKIGNRNSNFQASVFRNTITRKVMIAYRGTENTISN